MLSLLTIFYLMPMLPITLVLLALALALHCFDARATPRFMMRADATTSSRGKYFCRHRRRYHAHAASSPHWLDARAVGAAIPAVITVMPRHTLLMIYCCHYWAVLLPKRYAFAKFPAMPPALPYLLQLPLSSRAYGR